MSAAASAVKVVPTKGFAQVPNSLIENQVIFTRAELALALIVLRRGGQSESVPVSDRNWQTWTGLSPRLKEYAVAGLRKKCLMVKGRGDAAKYQFAREQWDTFVRTVNRTPARTVGRAVDPKPGTKIHQACRDRGCALLASTTPAGPELVTSPESPSNAQPVAQGCTDNPNTAAAGAGGSSRLIPLPSPSNAQRVARTATDAAEQIWIKTLAALQSVFPLVGVVFLVRLVAIVRALFHDVSDGELASAVDFAWRAKQRTQTSEGLFLLTVPAAVGALRRRKAAGGGRGSGGVSLPAGLNAPALVEGVRMLVDRVRDALGSRGAPFAGLAAELGELAAGLSVDFAGELESVERRMLELEGRIVKTARDQLNESERRTVAACVESQLGPYIGRNMSAVQLESIRSQVADRETMTVLGIPRLSMFYA